MNQVKRKYGLFTGIVLVVGTVIGCGVFIKSGAVMKVTAGSLPLSLVAWLIGGLIMVAGAFCFGVYATRVEKFNGCVDYIEYASNRTIGYYFGYFLGVLCFPIVTSHVAFVGGSYLVACFVPRDSEFLSWSSWPVLLVALLLITMFFLLNYFAPKISHKFQVSILFVKVAPIVIVVLTGIFAKLINPDAGVISAFINPGSGEDVVNNFGEAIKITSFAYDGWICVAAFNAEMKDSKKTLPRAIVGGTVAVVILYILYFIFASALVGNQTLIDWSNMNNGMFAVVPVFEKLMGSAGVIIILILLFGSCMGSTNVMVTTISRTFIALGVRGEGFIPNRMSKTKGDDFTATPYLFTYGVTIFFALIWYLAFRGDIPFFNYLKDMDTIVCSLIYGGYIIVYVYIIKNFKDEGTLKRYVMPIISIIGSLFFIVCGTGIYQLIAGQGPEALTKFACFLALAVIVYIPGLVVFYRNHQNKVPANVI